MTIAELMEKMITFTAKDSDVLNHDINHFMKVWSFAKTIGELEGLDENEQYILEASAILHDIACPYCRRTYGHTNGKEQEKDGLWLTENFLKDTDIPDDKKQRIIFIVSHHHTYENVEGRDWQIMLEADFLVNADEAECSKEVIKRYRDNVFKTDTGVKLLEKIYMMP